tara:strand:+ start:448 stop:981 length:534 start_codon:yes stop_codon:yes gene_type:complete
MSQLKVNSIVPAGGLPSGANGGIVQIVNSHLKTRQSISASSSFQATGLSATITPSSNNSKILIIVNGVYSVNNSTTTQYMSKFKLYNGSTEITDANSTGSTNNAWKSLFEADINSGASQQFELLTVQGDYLYTHGGSAGSAITINLYATSTVAMFLNGRNQTDFGTTSSMTLMELGG